MLFRLLGPLEVTDGNRPVAFGEGRQRSVLDLLLLHRNEMVSSDRLIDALWPELNAASGTRSLQVAVTTVLSRRLATVRLLQGCERPSAS